MGTFGLSQCRPAARMLATLGLASVFLNLASARGQDVPSTPTISVVTPEARSLLGRDLLSAGPGTKPKAEASLAEAERALAADPTNVERVIWVGRRQGYLWRMRAAIATFTAGLREHPASAALYRHRGHRYLSVRQFEEAIADLRRAAELMAGEADAVEPDGQPNSQNKPLTTLGFNVYYHLGLAHFLRGDYRDAVAAYEQCMKFAEQYADNRVATSYWMYLSWRKLGNEPEAQKLAATITPELEIIENDAYHRLLLLFNGTRTLEETLAAEQKAPTDAATIAYGVGMWHALSGDEAKAIERLEAAVAGENWPAFGFIAAEVELARRKNAAKGP